MDKRDNPQDITTGVVVVGTGLAVAGTTAALVVGAPVVLPLVAGAAVVGGAVGVASSLSSLFWGKK